MNLVNQLYQKRQDEKKEAKRSKKTSTAIIRAQRDFTELELPPNCLLNQPDPQNLLHFTVSITPDDGYWKGATYRFNFELPDAYPHRPPSVSCGDPIYHPNIDTQGSMTRYREACIKYTGCHSWADISSSSTSEPNPNDPLNHQAAEVMRDNPAQFKRNVENSLSGSTVAGIRYPINKRKK